MYDFLRLAEHALVCKMKLFAYFFKAFLLFADCDYKIYYFVPVTALEHFFKRVLARRVAVYPEACLLYTSITVNIARKLV